MLEPIVSTGISPWFEAISGLLGWGVTVALAVLALVAIDDAVFDLRGLWIKMRARSDVRAPVLIAPEPVVDLAALHGPGVRTIAILMPAWREQHVLQRAIRELIKGLNHDDFHVFIGVSPNDSATIAQATRLAADFENVHSLVMPSPGPSPAAFCVNLLAEFATARLNKAGTSADGFVVLHPGESPHPLFLKLFEQALAHSDIVRLPVFGAALWESRIEGYLAAQLAVRHVRDFSNRAMDADSVSGEGLVFGFSAKAWATVTAVGGKHDFLSIGSDVADYELTHRYRDLDDRGFWGRLVTLAGEPGPVYASAVAVRRYMPAQWPRALRYRSRRIAGLLVEAIAAVPALYRRRAGFAAWHALWRDMRAIPVTHLVVAGVFSGALLCALHLASGAGVFAWWRQLPGGEVTYGLGFLALCGVVASFAQHCRCVSRVYGSRSLAEAVPNYFVGLFFECCASMAASVSVIARLSKPAGTHKARNKQQSFEGVPVLNTAVQSSARIGERLVANKVITAKQLAGALETQRLSQKPLGRILVDEGTATELAVLDAVADQLQLPVKRFDAAGLPARVGMLLPRTTILEHRVFPIGFAGDGALQIACYRVPDRAARERISREAGVRTRLCLAPRSEVRQGMRLFMGLADTVDDRLLSASHETLGTLSARLRRGTRERVVATRRSTSPDRLNAGGLGDYLVMEGYIDRRSMKRCVELAAARTQSLGDYLVNQGFIDSPTLDEAIRRMRRVRSIRLVAINGNCIDETVEPVEFLGSHTDGGFGHAR